MKFKWTVEFEVEECWVADGYNLTDQRALDMLANDLGWADIGTELAAKVVAAPAPEKIAKAQGLFHRRAIPRRRGGRAAGR